MNDGLYDSTNSRFHEFTNPRIYDSTSSRFHEFTIFLWFRGNMFFHHIGTVDHIEKGTITQNDILIYLGNSFETCEVINSSEEDLMQEKVNVRPNPATEIINIGLPAGNSICSIKLLDLLGKTQQQISLNPGSTKQTLDVRDLPKGCYILKVYSTNGSCKAMKVVAGSR